MGILLQFEAKKLSHLKLLQLLRSAQVLWVLWVLMVVKQFDLVLRLVVLMLFRFQELTLKTERQTELQEQLKSFHLLKSQQMWFQFQSQMRLLLPFATLLMWLCLKSPRSQLREQEGLGGQYYRDQIP